MHDCNPRNKTACLQMGHPWEIQRRGIVYPIQFFGEVQVGEGGKRRWVGGEKVLAQAYDVPIPGYKTKNTISLRLWSAEVPAEYFKLEAFNNGEYEEATKAWATAAQVRELLFDIVCP
jgi:starch phosphorylase